MSVEPEFTCHGTLAVSGSGPYLSPSSREKERPSDHSNGERIVILQWPQNTNTAFSTAWRGMINKSLQKSERSLWDFRDRLRPPQCYSLQLLPAGANDDGEHRPLLLRQLLLPPIIMPACELL